MAQQQTSGSASSGPVGDGNYRVRRGDCMASIAYEAGFAWKTLWEHPRNAEIKRVRTDPNVLLDGDLVYIPELRVREETRSTDSRHRFVRKGIPEVLTFVLLDRKGRPRRSLPYQVEIDGVRSSGATDSQGQVKVPIPPNARQGTLLVQTETEEEEYDLMLGHMDPVTEITGVQARLNNLGYLCGEVDGRLGPKTENALRDFQSANDLDATGEPDQPTRDALLRIHGF